MQNILIVDDDNLLRQSLRERLVSENFSVREAPDAATALALMEGGGHPDAMILDVGLPDMDGRDLCGRFRDDGVTVPIIMLTGADSENDTVRGLESGANDYVTKPFRFAILLARLRVHLRQHENTDAASYRIGPYVFRPSQKLLVKGARKIRLTDKEVGILKCLYRADGVVPRGTLLTEVWGYGEDIATHTVESHIYRLRQKIEEDPGDAKLLVTEGGGYRLHTA